MKKALLFAAILIAATTYGQSKDSVKTEHVKKDTTIQLLIPLAQYRALLYTIDQNIDSKKTSKDILDFLQKSEMIYDPKRNK